MSFIEARFDDAERVAGIVAMAYAFGANANVNHVRVLHAAPAVGVLLDVGAQAAVSVRPGEDVRERPSHWTVVSSSQPITTAAGIDAAETRQSNRRQLIRLACR